MAIRIIVFDFDGTLIDSNKLKYNTFFELFPQNEFYKEIIIEVLEKFFEESRYIILKEILKRIEENCVKTKTGDIEIRIKKLANKYNDIVVAGVRDCKEKSCATKVLESLSVRYRLYLNSTTPELALRDIIKHRRWKDYFCDIFGYPGEKVPTLLKIIQKEKVNPNEVLVVGDRKVDRISASKVGCRFFPSIKMVNLRCLLITLIII